MPHGKKEGKRGFPWSGSGQQQNACLDWSQNMSRENRPPFSIFLVLVLKITRMIGRAPGRRVALCLLDMLVYRDRFCANFCQSPKDLLL